MNRAEDKDRWMKDLLSGDLDRNDPKVRHWLESTPGAAEELEALSGLAVQLGQAGCEQREALEQARELKNAPGSELVAPALEALIRSNSRARLPNKPGLFAAHRYSFLLVAAAVLCVALPFFWNALQSGSSSENSSAPIYLGANDFELSASTNSLGESIGLHWSYELSPGGWFSVELWNSSDPRGAEPFARITRYTRQEWTPDKQLPASIRVQLKAYDAAGEIERAWSGELDLSH